MAGGAKHPPMADLDPHPHVTGEDLRAAFARDRRQRRSNPLLESAPIATETVEREEEHDEPDVPETPEIPEPVGEEPTVTRGSEPAWDWDADEPEDDSAELRAAVERLAEELETAVGERNTAVAHAEELRAALVTLASASVFQRGRVVAELRSRSLLE
jgi:hypothetical protein